jgi:CheY-like chemotaxis protein
MSHELRTPLNAVLGFADLLLADPAEPPRPLQRERLQHLRLAGRQLLALIDEVLEIARQGGGTDDDARAATAALQALLQRQATEAAQPASPPATGRPEGARVDLVYVEDNPVNLLLVQQVLAQRPHLRLHAAATVQEGAALVKRIRPALVLVDLHLPDGDGLDLLALLRTGPDPVAAPCVVLSADAQPQQVQRALAAGFEAYWTKPIDVAGFLDEIDARLRA